MGAWLVAALVAGEAFLLGAGITGRSDRVRLAPLVRGGALLSIGTLLLTGAIEWSPRYYAVIVWLVATTLLGLRRWSRRGQPVAGGRAIVVGLSTLLVTFLAASPILVFPEFSPILPTGELPVASSVRTIVDTSRVDPFSKHGRDRLLTIGIWYPVDSGATYPLVVFSHGAFGIRDSNVSLFTDLASHGYVVASVDHTWHSLFSTDESGHTVLIAGAYMRDVRAEDAGRDPERSFRLYQEWMGLRMADLDFVIDYILDHRGDPVFGLVDRSRIGLAGHSLGGAAALGLGRSRTDVDAVVALEAPFLADIRGVEDGHFIWDPDPYPTPVLCVYSDSAWGHLDEWPQYRGNLEVAREPISDTVHLEGVGHLHLTDLGLTSPFLTRVLNGHPSTGDAREALEVLNRHTVAFFDLHLKKTRESRGPFDG